MITIPIWVFTILCLIVGVFGLLLIFDICIRIKDKVEDFIEWKTNYKKYKEFWDENEDLR